MNNLGKFMLESNRIEGEDRLNPGDMDAIDYALLNGIVCLEDILKIHALLGAYLKKDWVGKWRTVNVRVGDDHLFPDAHSVPVLMVEYASAFPDMDSWEAHNRFEKIHPFRDLNGRVGRIIWLIKAIKRGYNFKTSFLQAYYYQTLKRHDVKMGNEAMYCCCDTARKKGIKCPIHGAQDENNSS